MAEKRDENFEEGSSSHGTERVSNDEDALFKAQLVSFMKTFQQMAKHPKMQELLQAPKTPTQTQKASSQSLQSPRRRNAHVVEQPPASIGHRQPSTHGLVNGQDSNEQAMTRLSPALHGFMLDNAYGAMHAGSSNPMYGNIGAQPGFQCAANSYGMPGANMGMAGFLQSYAQNLNLTGKAPFEIVEGGKKVPPILQTKDKIFEVDKYVQKRDEAYEKIKYNFCKRKAALDVLAKLKGLGYVHRSRSNMECTLSKKPLVKAERCDVLESIGKSITTDILSQTWLQNAGTNIDVSQDCMGLRNVPETKAKQPLMIDSSEATKVETEPERTLMTMTNSDGIYKGSEQDSFWLYVRSGDTANTGPSQGALNVHHSAVVLSDAEGPLWGQYRGLEVLKDGNVENFCRAIIHGGACSLT
ncbi:hypothetical protein L7F22_040946 [Adiantum nelumboides]|nr:hypothetical protein [Adiantum nelumboides]